MTLAKQIEEAILNAVEESDTTYPDDVFESYDFTHAFLHSVTGLMPEEVTDAVLEQAEELLLENANLILMAVPDSNWIKVMPNNVSVLFGIDAEGKPALLGLGSDGVVYPE